MLAKGIAIIGLGIFSSILTGCIKHEVIPAPEPVVDKTCSFEGNIGGAFVQFTEHVNGYEGESYITTQTGISNNSAQYLFSMISSDASSYMRIGLGSIAWSVASGTTTPALADFNDFFAITTNPNYSLDALNGFEVVYHSANGKDYISNENSTNAQSVTFSNIDQESDSQGDYSKFVCNFNCYLYHTDPVTSDTDSIQVTNGVYQGWFKR